MNRKIYLIALGIVVLVFLIVIEIIFEGRKVNPPSNIAIQIHPTIAPSREPSYIIEDMANSPQSIGAMAHGTIIRETNNTSGPGLQRFIIKEALGGPVREIFEVNETDISFEKITEQNWSPTNKFLFIYIDYPQRRDVLFIKTDGKFTNGSYYLHSTGLYPNINVLSAKWLDEQTLELQTTDIKTKTPQKYLVSFDDDSGIVTPE